MHRANHYHGFPTTRLCCAQARAWELASEITFARLSSRAGLFLAWRKAAQPPTFKYLQSSRKRRCACSLGPYDGGVIRKHSPNSCQGAAYHVTHNHAPASTSPRLSGAWQAGPVTWQAGHELGKGRGINVIMCTGTILQCGSTWAHRACGDPAARPKPNSPQFGTGHARQEQHQVCPMSHSQTVLGPKHVTPSAAKASKKKTQWQVCSNNVVRSSEAPSGSQREAHPGCHPRS